MEATEDVVVVYKSFGSRFPSDEFKQALAEFCDLEEDQREAIEEWFKSTRDYNLYTADPPPGIAASTVLPEQFIKCARPILHLLNNWQRFGTDLEDIERDLLVMGFTGAQLETVSKSLARLSVIKERVWIDGLEGNAQVAGLPTIDDANIIWDARPVFGGPTFFYYSSDSDAESYKKCFGFTCMAILEIISSGVEGSVPERTSIQMNEETFKRLLSAMKRADDQLEALKGMVKLVSPPDKHVDGGSIQHG
jgi:hypothetical protein